MTDRATTGNAPQVMGSSRSLHPTCSFPQTGALPNGHGRKRVQSDARTSAAPARETALSGADREQAAPEVGSSPVRVDAGDEITFIDGHAIDALGNPMVKTTGCPNCGKGAGWLTIIEVAAAANSGRDPDGPCSRACALQLEWAETLRARATTEEED